MGISGPIKTKVWLAFLTHLKCKKKRVKGSHHIYTCPNCIRPIVCRESDKDMPAMHVRSNLKTLGISEEDFLDWKKKNS